MNTSELLLVGGQPDRQPFIGRHVVAFVDKTFAPSVGVGDWSNLYDTYADEMRLTFRSIEPIDTVLQNSTQFMLNILNRPSSLYNERDLELLEKRFGLRDVPRTLQATGNLYGISRERVRQISARQRNMLAQPKRMKRILEFIESIQ